MSFLLEKETSERKIMMIFKNKLNGGVGTFRF